MKQRKIIIIGAGIGGLALANLLAHDGHEVHVYEAAAGPGGRAGRKHSGGFTFDTGPSWYLMPGVFERYYSLIGESVDRHLNLVRLSPAYRVFFEDNTSIDITSDLERDAATFESLEPGAGKALRRYVEKSELIYHLSLKYFLYTNFTSLRELMHPEVLRNGFKMLRMSFTSIHSYVSSFVRHKKLQQILEYPMVFLGTSPFQAPAIYSLMGALDFKEGVYYPQGGIYTIIESLTRIGSSLGVTYHYGQPVTHIVTSDGRATGITLSNGETVSADIVVSNADLHYTETQLLHEGVQSYPETYWQGKQASPSALLMYLGVSGSIDEFQHHNLLFVDDWEGNFTTMDSGTAAPERTSMYICNPNKTDPTVAPADTENLFVLVPLPPGLSVDGEQAEKLASRYIAQIESMTGAHITSRIIEQSYIAPDDFAETLHSWRSSMLGPSHILRQSAFFRTPNKSKKLSNFYYVGASTVPGIGLPMCLIGAELVQKRIREADVS